MTQPMRASTIDPTNGKTARYELHMSPEGDIVTCIRDGSTDAMEMRGPAGEGPAVFNALMARLEKLGYLVVTE